MAALTGKSARIKTTAATATTAAAQAFTAVASTTDVYTYRITSTSRRHWDRTVQPAVSVGASTQNPSAYTVNYTQGRVTFGSAQTTAAVITADLSYLTSSYLASARGWAMDVETDMLDVTTLSTNSTDVQWREYGAGLSGAAATVERVTKTDSTGMAFFDRGVAGQDLVVEFITDDANKFEAFAHLEGDEFASVVDGLSDENVALKIDGQLYYSTL